MKKYFDGLQRVSKGLKKGLKNDDMTSNFYDFASRGFTETIWSNVCNMYHEPRIIPAGYIRSSRFDGPDVEF